MWNGKGMHSLVFRATESLQLPLISKGNRGVVSQKSRFSVICTSVPLLKDRLNYISSGKTSSYLWLKSVAKVPNILIYLLFIPSLRKIYGRNCTKKVQRPIPCTWHLVIRTILQQCFLLQVYLWWLTDLHV